MSLERFFLICFDIILPPFFWFFLVAATWIPPIIIAILVLVYPQELSVTSKSKAACTVIPSGPGYAYFLCTMTLFILSFICVISGYIGIIVVKFRQCLNQLNLNVPKDQVYKECRVTITKSFVYIFLYLLVFMSKFVIVCYELSTGKRRTLEMDAVSNCMVSCSVLANALALLYMQNDVRVSFYEQLNKIKKSLFCLGS
ncbi:hypothetical protein CONCODRAFT_11996 [Conidiobolus coronatus NRRL 28638]|uniref:G-protein coupled receptors family 1 profile domain-containing protein n=1 Tax=Conidiobolus coronatus (strain ATCC 28846 / CBS 209.66 / NRRL 28638) TaxID=796925 RepID=A0A137NTV1_CONC2|nr:hypothetical protein CONCODRAFT_11996 [Conidiobolus coronatus NRRL 28638]|eukprot:KXN66207.1 hypothetical protein CONCODRAFT_11996 [Conidiobolus coronatus NRRL 28638]